MTNDAETPKLVPVADGFFVRQEIDNIAWVDLGGYAVVVDALEHPEKEDEVFSALARTLGDVPVRYVLNTHTHYDHVALNPAFQRYFGAEIINQQIAPLGPEGRWFRGSRRSLHMLPAPGCHTEEDCVLWLPEDRALFVGDLFGWGLIPLTRALRNETAVLLLETYDRLLAYDAAVVVPGHGPLITSGELRRWTEYFRWLVAETARLVVEGADDDGIRRQLAPPQDMRGWWRFLAWKHEDSVSKVLRAVRRGLLTVAAIQRGGS